MRTNKQLKDEWLKRALFEDVCINIFIMNIDDECELTIALDVNESMDDYECIMIVEGNEPTKEMYTKMKNVYNYFKKHFTNVKCDKTVINV